MKARKQLKNDKGHFLSKTALESMFQTILENTGNVESEVGASSRHAKLSFQGSSDSEKQEYMQKCRARRANSCKAKVNQLYMDVSKRTSQLAVLRESITTAYFNDVLQPFEGIIEPEDLADESYNWRGQQRLRKSPPVDLSLAQTTRLREQCISVAAFLEELNRRDASIIKDLECEILRLQNLPGDADARADGPVKFHDNKNAAQCAEAAAKTLPKESDYFKPPQPSTILRWHYAFQTYASDPLNNGMGKFVPLLTGKQESGWVLMEEEGMLTKFVKFMRLNLRNLTAEMCQKFLNETLLAEIPAGLLESYRIKLPIHVSTARRYMRWAGAESGWYQNGYFNDQHQNEEVIAYRKDFITKSYHLWVRQHLWVQMTKKTFLESVLPCLLIEEFPEVAADGFFDNLEQHALPFDILSDPAWMSIKESLVGQKHPDRFDPGTVIWHPNAIPGDFTLPNPTGTSSKYSRKPLHVSSPQEMHKEVLQRCNQADLKHMLKAANMTMSGNKLIQLARLLHFEQNFDISNLDYTSPSGIRLKSLASMYYIYAQPDAVPQDDGASGADIGSAAAPVAVAAPAAAPAPENSSTREVEIVGEAVDAGRVEGKVQATLQALDEKERSIANDATPKLIYPYIDKDTGAVMVEVFIDLMDVDRSAFVCGGNMSVRFIPKPRDYVPEKCPNGVHAPEVCKCHLPLIEDGQDECVFNNFALSKRVWKLDGAQMFRKKSDGAGWMISAFQNEIFGFGLPMKKEELHQV